MMSSKNELPEFLSGGEPARLIPVLSSSQKERYVTSCTLATLMSVDQFAKRLLSSIGIPLGKRSKIETFTEVQFRSKGGAGISRRPDGLIVVTTGKRRWVALIESKIGKTELATKQVEDYLDLAREHKIDAVITLSNQFAILPTHHPLTVSKLKTRKVSLFHWSWTYLVTEARTLLQYGDVTDPDKAYILEELARCLEHKNSGILSFDRMNKGWKDVCTSIQKNIIIKKNNEEVQKSVASWHQLIRSNALSLGFSLGEDISVILKRDHRNDAKKHLEDDVLHFVNKKTLVAEFDIPGAASRIKFIADANKRSVTATMRLQAPTGRTTTKGRINWFVGQLKKSTDDKGIGVKAIWPGRSPKTHALLTEIRRDGYDILIGDKGTLKPTAFDIILTRGLGSNFANPKNFIKESTKVLFDFYEYGGQHLKAWVASPPKVKVKSVETFDEDMNETQAVMTDKMTIAEDVLSFWFAEGMEERHFKKDPDFDEEIRAKFHALYTQAKNGELDHWQENPRAALALIILLDQFPRNMFRDTPQAFATDPQACAAAQNAIANGYDKSLTPPECRFLYMPLMHSEDLAIQNQAVALYEKLDLKYSTEFAIAHRDIIARFGRFPHRNAILNRQSTAEETHFLTQPGSSF